MKKSYYLFNPGRLSRKDNTFKFTPVDENGVEKKPKYLPVEGVEQLHVFGSLDLNSAMINFTAKHQIPIHFFDYYENYTGSMMPKDHLLSGKMIISQTRYFTNKQKRIDLAQRLLDGASFNMLKNLRYYANRGKELDVTISTIEGFRKQIEVTIDTEELMGLEGNIRHTYYQGFSEIIDLFDMEGRSKQPPKNEVNALISFGNMVCYTTCLTAIFHTQLNPTISFLHSPGERRYSLALDLAEIFKPVLVDRVIFKVLNRKMIKAEDFDKQVNSCMLKQNGRKKFLKAYEERLTETIKHRKLNRSVSYKQLVKLECYKLSKHVLGVQEYEPFKVWW